MTRILSAYVREFGPLNLATDILGIAAGFALIGIAFASPAATTATANSPAFVDAAAWGDAK